MVTELYQQPKREVDCACCLATQPLNGVIRMRDAGRPHRDELQSPSMVSLPPPFSLTKLILDGQIEALFLIQD